MATSDTDPPAEKEPEASFNAPREDGVVESEAKLSEEALLEEAEEKTPADEG